MTDQPAEKIEAAPGGAAAPPAASVEARRGGGAAAWLDRTWGQVLAFGGAGLLFPFALSGAEGSVSAVVLVCALLATGTALRTVGVWRLRTRHGL